MQFILDVAGHFWLLWLLLIIDCNVADFKSSTGRPDKTKGSPKPAVRGCISQEGRKVSHLCTIKCAAAVFVKMAVILICGKNVYPPRGTQN